MGLAGMMGFHHPLGEELRSGRDVLASSGGIVSRRIVVAQPCRDCAARRGFPMTPQPAVQSIPRQTAQQLWAKPNRRYLVLSAMAAVGHRAGHDDLERRTAVLILDYPSKHFAYPFIHQCAGAGGQTTDQSRAQLRCGVRRREGSEGKPDSDCEVSGVSHYAAAVGVALRPTTVFSTVDVGAGEPRGQPEEGTARMVRGSRYRLRRRRRRHVRGSGSPAPEKARRWR